uniref:Uncharacterized protein n=1 Tax=Panagrellus redivivus TaxID=6233 RepID=A0A7E4VRK5_PANRE
MHPQKKLPFHRQRVASGVTEKGSATDRLPSDDAGRRILLSVDTVTGRLQMHDDDDRCALETAPCVKSFSSLLQNFESEKITAHRLSVMIVSPALKAVQHTYRRQCKKFPRFTSLQVEKNHLKRFLWPSTV